ncbi:uncharacterized protein LOC121876809 [Homarus americanus]|uniref:uncharacterized protein LOC121876809 n=1 Tax=Homarus americanus TaxID=6706 RepID=UPI001C48CE95|nr:uncharacterized protein LOC121876809 [Homarus americanus]
MKSWLVVVLMGVVVAGEDGGEGGLQPLLGMFGSSWPQDSPRTSHPTHTPISDTNNYVNTSENHVTSLWYHDNFYSLTDKNGTIHKLLNKSIGTGILDKALDYLFNKLGTSYGGGQDDAHLGHHQLTPTWHQKKESVKDDGYYGHSSGRSYQGDNWYVSTPEQSVCKTSLGSFLGMCLDVHTALTLAALAILLQFIVSFTISSICPASTSSHPLILNINTTHVFNFTTEKDEDECPGGRNDDCEIWTDTRTAPRLSYHDLFPNLEDYTDLSGSEGYVSVDSEERRYDEERDPRRHDLLTTLREWLVRPSWQTVAKTFRESSFLSNSDPCKILRGFVSG